VEVRGLARPVARKWIEELDGPLVQVDDRLTRAMGANVQADHVFHLDD
jgi:hypothetical protein